MALTKAEMADKLFDQLGLNKREAKDLAEGFFECLRNSLENGQQVKLSGFGNFDLRDKNQRPGRKPGKQAKRYLSVPEESLPLGPVKNSKPK